MTIYAILPFTSGVIFFFFGLFILLRNMKARLNQFYFLTCLSVSIWIIFYSFMYGTREPQKALLYARIGYSGVVFIPTFLYNFVATFLGLKRRQLFSLITFCISTFFLVIATTDLFLNGMYTYFWGFYPRVGPFYWSFVIFFGTVFVYCACISFKHLFNKQISPIVRNQIKYIMLANLVASTSLVDYVQNYNIEIYPWGYISAIGWLSLMAVAIFKYRLIDLRLAVTKAGLFIAVYTLVLGVPFAVGAYFRDVLSAYFGANWWIFPLTIMALLATSGPFLHIFLQQRAEDNLLKEQKRYQNTLKHAAIGMTRIRNIRRLLSLITHIVTKSVKISFAAIYLFDKQANEYSLQVYRGSNRVPLTKIAHDATLIHWLNSKKEPLIYEEVKRMSLDTSDSTVAALEANMRLLTASVIIPSFLEDRLLGFFVLGDKLTGQVYTPEDLNVFQVLASQAALAIENAQFYEEAKEMQAQIAQAEKMATVGTMADGLSHQINNRFYALSLIAGDSIDTIKMTDTSQCTPEVAAMINQINAALERIQVNVMQGGEVVKGILKYTRKGQEGFEALSLDQILDGTLEMVQYKVKLNEIDLIRNYPQDLPKLKVNMVQMQEVFFNLIDNGYDAIVERRNTLKEPGYRGSISITARAKDHRMEILVQDNGIGVKHEDIKKIFTPFFTTKASSRKGTGLGLYVIRSIVTENHAGTISFASEYKKNTSFTLELPIADESLT